jgi:hypothetical protein
VTVRLPVADLVPPEVMRASLDALSAELDESERLTGEGVTIATDLPTASAGLSSTTACHGA